MKNNNTIIEITVNNHPGVLSHIAGLFSRRAFNLEGVLCSPIEGGDKSKMYLLVNKANGTEQIIKQLEKLYDVLEVVLNDDYNVDIFNTIHDLVKV